MSNLVGDVTEQIDQPQKFIDLTLLEWNERADERTLESAVCLWLCDQQWWGLFLVLFCWLIFSVNWNLAWWLMRERIYAFPYKREKDDSPKYPWREPKSEEAI
jgi:hypothetical protein